VGCRRSGDHIRLEVRFSGVLPDRGRNRNAFVQLPSPAGDELGLGLPLLQHLCARLGHDLHHTELGGRHLLALTLPLLASSGEAAPVSR
jgi:hypothetical protein